MYRLLALLLLCIYLASSQQGFSWQTTDSLAVLQPSDTALSPFVQKVLEAADLDKRRSQATYEAGKIAIKQRIVWDALTHSAQEVKLYLDKGVNFSDIKTSLKSIETSFAVVQDGIFINQGTAQTERNLSVSSSILNQLIVEIEHHKKTVDNYTDNLTGYRNRIDSLLSEPVVYAFPRDSVLLVQYLSRLRVIVAEGDPSDNALNESLKTVQDLQNKVDALLFRLKVSREKIESYRKKLAYLNLEREFADIWQPVGFSRPFSEIVKFSLAKERMALHFYVRENLFRIFGMLCCILLVYGAIRSLKKRLANDANGHDVPAPRLILVHPLAAALVMVLSIYQFVFIGAPFIFGFCIWAIQVVGLFLLLRKFITPFWLNFWIILSGLFLLACADNFILQASRTERWIMAAIALGGIVYGSYIIFTRHRGALKEKSIILFIRFMVLAELLSFILNLLGRYNLSKAFLAAGYTGAVIAILFLWVVRMINEGLGLGAAVYRYPERKLFYINFNRLGTKAPVLLYVLLAVGWGVLVGRNFYAFKRIAVPFGDFLHQERNLGDYNFSINGLFLFLLIGGCSLLLSRIISFFAADPQAIHGNSSNQRTGKVTAGSWILLVRIFIISVGLFLAFAAAGLPLDKITIVLGALSVGIGLGLQGLVSNLVSGLIIAFERPVNVGDFIEIDGKSGMMKSIGFRSSIVALGDGSNLVVPNGDLLNNHLVNWSAAKNAKRLTVPVRIAYGSDLGKVKEILQQVAASDERVLSSPEAIAVPKGFGENAVSFDLVFWVRNQRDTLAVTGDIIIAIDKAFRDAGIAIPFPRQDIHLHQDGDHKTGDAGTGAPVPTL